MSIIVTHRLSIYANYLQLHLYIIHLLVITHIVILFYIANVNF